MLPFLHVSQSRFAVQGVLHRDLKWFRILGLVNSAGPRLAMVCNLGYRY